MRFAPPQRRQTDPGETRLERPEVPTAQGEVVPQIGGTLWLFVALDDRNRIALAAKDLFAKRHQLTPQGAQFALFGLRIFLHAASG